MIFRTVNQLLASPDARIKKAIKIARNKPHARVRPAKLQRATGAECIITCKCGWYISHGISQFISWGGKTNECSYCSPYFRALAITQAHEEALNEQ